MAEQTVPTTAMVRTWRAVPGSVVELRRAVVDFARREGARDLALSSIKLAVSEAASNVVLHAYSGAGEPGPVHVLAEREGDALRVIVTDEGAGMLPRPDSPGLGLGLPLIAQLVDSLEVARTQSGGTALCMRFRL